MVSMGVDGQDIPPQMWKLVWRHQLRLQNEAEFWAGLGGAEPHYAVAPVAEPPQPLPAFLIRFLRDTLDMSDEEIDAMPRSEAQQRLDDYHSRELRGP